MPLVSQTLRREIREFLLSIRGIDDKDFCESVGRDADFPENLHRSIDWGKQPPVIFVDHLIEVALRWGTFSEQDSRHALVEYLRATKAHGGGQHQKRLAELLKILKDTLSEDGDGPIVLPRFVNREKEIRKLTDEYSLSSRYAIHAPAGYGKTWLLQRLQYEFNREGWLAAYATLNKHGTVLDLTNDLLNSLKYPDRVTPSPDVGITANKFGGALKALWDQMQSRPRKGIVLLIDLEDLPEEISNLSTIIRDWLSIVTENIQAHKDFEDGENQLRTIISGRFFDDKILESLQGSDPQFSIYPLTPFDDVVVKQSVQKYLPKLAVGLKTQLWSGLLYHTGGHPGCMSEILELYSASGAPNPATFIRNSNQLSRDK